MKELRAALAKLAQQYSDQLDDFNMKIENDLHPVWMTEDKLLAARVLLQAKREMAQELLAELPESVAPKSLVAGNPLPSDLICHRCRASRPQERMRSVKIGSKQYVAVCKKCP